MTEPRYSNGKLAKWYYSRNRTISDGTYEYYLLNKAEIELEDGTTIFGSNKLLDKLNELSEENTELKKQREELFIRERNTKNKLRELKKENKELNSIKCFADNNGINIFNIDEAFHRCWNDNEKLVIKNKELQERNNRQCRQLDNLYKLIEKQDWKTLKGLIQEFQECEEQLQKEWSDYE